MMFILVSSQTSSIDNRDEKNIITTDWGFIIAMGSGAFVSDKKVNI